MTCRANHHSGYNAACMSLFEHAVLEHDTAKETLTACIARFDDRIGCAWWHAVTLFVEALQHLILQSITSIWALCFCASWPIDRSHFGRWCIHTYDCVGGAVQAINMEMTALIAHFDDHVDDAVQTINAEMLWLLMLQLSFSLGMWGRCEWLTLGMLQFLYGEIRHFEMVMLGSETKRWSYAAHSAADNKTFLSYLCSWRRMDYLFWRCAVQKACSCGLLDLNRCGRKLSAEQRGHRRCDKCWFRTSRSTRETATNAC